ncbi:hypothetical protein [Pedobacter paludis]|nr:hypothetical protein [Pedobacter paludis]
MLTLFISFSLKAQNNIELSYDAASKTLTKTTTNAIVSAFNPLTAINIKVANLGTEILVVRATYNTEVTIAQSRSGNEINIVPLSADQVKEYRTYDISIQVGSAQAVNYTYVAKKNDTPTVNNLPSNSIAEEIRFLFPRFNINDYGIKVIAARDASYQYTGDDYTHIFLDQFGNVLLGVMPQGVANRQYIVHVVYLTEKENPNRISYSINQTKGAFSATLVFNNAGQMGSNLGAQAGGSTDKTVSYVWKHQEFPLRISTDNIEFELYRNNITYASTPVLESTLIAKKTIEMTKLYHGSFDVGVLNTRLANPSYELLPSNSAPDQKVVKESNQGDRIVLTAMATFYVSPIVLLESLTGKDIPKYKLYGRNFFDDHKFYERIFPSIGVAVSEKALKNIFFGFNWELVRGASVFGGVHYGEVNTFSHDDNFKFQQTAVSEADFNLRTNKHWKRGLSFGANLDVLVITNLLKAK